MWPIFKVSFPGGAVIKKLPANSGDARDLGSIPWLGRYLGVGNGNLLQYSFFFKFYFIFKLYIIVLVLPNIKMNPPQVYMCSPS